MNLFLFLNIEYYVDEIIESEDESIESEDESIESEDESIESDKSLTTSTESARKRMFYQLYYLFANSFLGKNYKYNFLSWGNHEN